MTNQIPQSGYHTTMNLHQNIQPDIKPSVGQLPGGSGIEKPMFRPHFTPNIWPSMPHRGGLAQQVQQLTQLVQQLIGLLTGRPAIPPHVRPAFPDINSLPGGGINSPRGIGRAVDIQTLPGRDIVALDQTGPVEEKAPLEVKEEKTPWCEKVMDNIDKGKKIFDSGKETWNNIKKYGADIWNGLKDAGRWVAGLFT